MAALVVLAVLAACCWKLSRWTEIPHDYAHPSEIMPIGSYDGDED